MRAWNIAAVLAVLAATALAAGAPAQPERRDPPLLAQPPAFEIERRDGFLPRRAHRDGSRRISWLRVKCPCLAPPPQVSIDVQRRVNAQEQEHPSPERLPRQVRCEFRAHCAVLRIAGLVEQVNRAPAL